MVDWHFVLGVITNILRNSIKDHTEQCKEMIKNQWEIERRSELRNFNFCLASLSRIT